MDYQVHDFLCLFSVADDPPPFTPQNYLTVPDLFSTMPLSLHSESDTDLLVFSCELCNEGKAF